MMHIQAPSPDAVEAQTSIKHPKFKLTSCANQESGQLLSAEKDAISYCLTWLKLIVFAIHLVRHTISKSSTPEATRSGQEPRVRGRSTEMLSTCFYSSIS